MEETRKIVRWTLWGIQGLFFVWALAELMLGLVTIYYCFTSPLHTIEAGGVVRMVLAFLVVMGIILGQRLYRRKMGSLHSRWNIEKKLRHYQSAYIYKMGFWLGAGFCSLMGFWVSYQPQWLLPWVFILFVMGKNYPFKINMCQELSLSDEERLFLE